MIGPALTALLSNTPREALGDVGPVFGALLYHRSGQDLIFNLCPSHVCFVLAVAEFKPTFVAFNFRFAREELAYTVPRALSEAINVLE